MVTLEVMEVAMVTLGVMEVVAEVAIVVAEVVIMVILEVTEAVAEEAIVVVEVAIVVTLEAIVEMEGHVDQEVVVATVDQVILAIKS